MFTRALIFHMSIPCDKTFPWVAIFDPVTLTLEFDLFYKQFKLDDVFWTVSHNGSIFHMSISCDKTFSVGINIFDTVTLTLKFDLLNFNLAKYFWTVNACALIFYICTWMPVFLVTRSFHVTLTLKFAWFFENFNIPNNFLTVSATFVVYIFHTYIPWDNIFLFVLNLLTLTFNPF